jgi:hypothetical protein
MQGMQKNNRPLHTQPNNLYTIAYIKRPTANSPICRRMMDAY